MNINVINILLFGLAATFLVLYILEKSKASDVKKDLDLMLKQQSDSVQCYVGKAAMGVDDSAKLGSLIGLVCAEKINVAMQSNDFSKVSPMCMKYFSNFAKNNKKWVEECKKNEIKN